MPVDPEEFKNSDAKHQIKSFLSNDPARFTDIVEGCEASKSTVSKYLKQFKEINLVTKDNQNRYKLLNHLESEDERILDTIMEKGCSSKEELSQVMSISVNLKTKIEKLIELGYLEGSPESIMITDKSLSHTGKTITGEDLDDQIIGHTTRNGGFESFQVDYDPVMNSPKGFLSFFDDVPNDVEICNHCGLPLNPEYIRKIANTDPYNPNEGASEDIKNKTEELISQLYGPIGSIYQMFKNYDSYGRGVTDEHYISYKKNGESYHPYCRQIIEQI